ncbi:MAG: di-heme oxidoredictase family protein [Planctomycetota bacterium]
MIRIALALSVLAGSAPLPAQYNERPDLLGSGSPACDASGRSIKDHRVRAISSRDASLEGGTAWMLDRDPFLAYQLGRDLNFREFRDRDGVFDARIGQLAGPMPDGVTAKITANNHTSCAGCHNAPQGNPGGGTNFHKDSGLGRQAPHYYGAGIVEMLALQVRSQMLWQIDRDRDGWVSVAESQSAAARTWIVPTPGAFAIDFGNPRLDQGATGRPRLDNIFRVWFVDAAGRHVPGATRVDGTVTHGYNFEMVVWGWGQGRGRSALNPTNRAFLWDPFKTHGGLESHDPSTTDDPDGDGVSVPTVAGAEQFPATHRPADRGLVRDALGFSRDDPDRDGHLTEISEGDLDLGEWFMLNVPRPAFAGTAREYRDGVEQLTEYGCTACHVAEWRVLPRNDDPSRGPTVAGDRRLFDLDVQWSERRDRFEGRLQPLFDRHGERHVRRFAAFAVPGFFSDLRHHDLGAASQEVDFGGNQNRMWRTPMLWGVGSGFPWMHDGQSLTLEDAIRRHDGEARASRLAFERSSRSHRQRLLAFLGQLQLYDIESLPADIDADGRVAESFVVGGMDTGGERFNAEWLFRTPLRIQGWFQNSDGGMVRSFAGTNIAEAYGQQLSLRLDGDGDGWPDAWDGAPAVPGYRDGVR